MKTIIIHHNDADGRCAAAIVGRSHFCTDIDIEYIEADYAMLKTSFCDDLIDRLDRLYESEPELTQVFVVDFSLPETCVAVIRKLCKFVWIDHHASAKTYTYHDVAGLRDFTDKGRSGCELAWEYCFPGVNTPTIVKLIGDYDTWRLDCEVLCKPLIVTLEAHQYAPTDVFWTDMLLSKSGDEEANAIDDIILAGVTMITYRDGYAAGMCKAFGFETEFEGHTCFAANIFRLGSMGFGDKMQKYDICIAFAYDGKLFTVSLYSEKLEIDCSVICKKHGGGGHKGAAGFTCSELPFGK